MMHAVEPPEGRDGMEQYVLKVHGKIQGGDGQWDAGPCRQIVRMQQAPSAGFGDQSKPDRGRGEDEADQNRIQDDDADVAGPARTAPELLSRRGASTSQTAIRAKIAAKATKRIWGS